MEKQIFETGDRVFDIRFGWGVIKGCIDNERSYPLKVVFDKSKEEYALYTKEGSDFLCTTPTLSFTEYTLEGFSQERPINYEDYVGKWGKFYDEEDEEFYSFTIHRLLKYNKEEGHFVLVDGDRYVYSNYFQPLTEEQIKILKLQDDNKK